MAKALCGKQGEVLGLPKKKHASAKGAAAS
jgi:hypothetical protein